MSKNLSELSSRKGLSKNLFEEYGNLAKATGTPDIEELEKLREEFLIGKATAYGAVSFYDFLKPANKNKKVYACNGSACMLSNTQDKLKAKLRNHFEEEEIGEMCCLGRCHENSAFHINKKNYSGNDIDFIEEIISKKTITKETYNVDSLGTPILTSDYGDVEEFYKIFTECLTRTPDELLLELRYSGLRGRGGAGFPIAFKFESCKNTEDDTKFIVSNADEGDPGAYSDRYIMEQRPHNMLMGMMISGYIIGAKHGVVYIRGEYPESIEIVGEAIDHLRSLGLLGENIQGTGFDFDFKVISAQGAYVCGEETALLSSIEGQRPEVRVRPPYPTQKGLFNKPTVVNNVETLANIPYIMKHGGKAYGEIGTPKSTGTKLISLDSYFNKPGIYEVNMGTRLTKVIEDLGGGFRTPVKAMHIGGPLGGIVPISLIERLSIDYDSFSKLGFLLGHASIVCIPEEYPMIDYVEHLFQFVAHESCGKCFPCRIGSTRGYELIAKAKNEDYKIDQELMGDLLDTLQTGSLCALGGGLPLPVRNAMQYFNSELADYFNK